MMAREDLDALEADLRRELAAARTDEKLARLRAESAEKQLSTWFGYGQTLAQDSGILRDLQLAHNAQQPGFLPGSQLGAFELDSWWRSAFNRRKSQ